MAMMLKKQDSKMDNFQVKYIYIFLYSILVLEVWFASLRNTSYFVI